jgi:integrase
MRNISWLAVPVKRNVSTFGKIFQVLLGGRSGALGNLRHTHATLMLKSGVHPKIVSERLGHATVAFTLDTYHKNKYLDSKKLLLEYLTIPLQ